MSLYYILSHFGMLCVPMHAASALNIEPFQHAVCPHDSALDISMLYVPLPL